jgi:hypothetical protein
MVKTALESANKSRLVCLLTYSVALNLFYDLHSSPVVSSTRLPNPTLTIFLSETLHGFSPTLTKQTEYLHYLIRIQMVMRLGTK